MRIIFCLAVSVTFLAGCASKKPVTGGNRPTQSNAYSEDLSVWRPKVEAVSDTVKAQSKNDRRETAYVEPKYNVNTPLDAVLDSIDRINLTHKFVDGFTIQVFTGDREGAMQAKRELSMSFPELQSEVKFETPNFRVKTGRYLSRLQAQKDFVSLKRHFPNAIVIPNKIELN